MISAKIIKDSIAPHGKRLTTFEWEYPRFIHSEIMTHRILSKNAASSRAIPISTTIKQLRDDPAMPVWWGKNQAGMSAKEELDDTIIADFGFIGKMTAKAAAMDVWLAARDSAIRYAEMLSEIGLHKQIANRILEPWVMMKTVITGTEWDNIFYLRDHEDAQPEFQAVVRPALDAYNNSTPTLLQPGQWHLPYVEDVDLTLADALKLSSSLCAQVSFRKADDSIEKAIRIYDRLVESKPVHASPFEHQGTPHEDPEHRSGNLIGFVQHRQLIPGNVCLKYDKIKR